MSVQGLVFSFASFLSLWGLSLGLAGREEDDEAAGRYSFGRGVTGGAFGFGFAFGLPWEWEGAAGTVMLFRLGCFAGMGGVAESAKREAREGVEACGALMACLSFSSFFSRARSCVERRLVRRSRGCGCGREGALWASLLGGLWDVGTSKKWDKAEAKRCFVGALFTGALVRSRHEVCRSSREAKGESLGGGLSGEGGMV